MAVKLALAAAAGAAAAAVLLRAPAGPVDEAALLSDWSAPPPWPVFRAAVAADAAIGRLPNSVTPPPLRALEIATGFTRSQLFYVASKLGFADACASGPKTAVELTAAAGLPPGRAALVFRALRALVGFGYFAAAAPSDSGDPRFSNTAVSAVLREAHPNSMKHMVQHQVEDAYHAWGGLLGQLTTGATSFDAAHGKSLWQ
eukprot:gene10679-18632_t